MAGPTIEQLVNQRVALAMGEAIIARIIAEAERDALHSQERQPMEKANDEAGAAG